MKNDLSDLSNISFQRYENSSPVCNFNGRPCVLEDLVKAFLVSSQSFCLGGEKGDGKTIVLEEVNSWFGGNGIYFRASPDMNVKDLFQHFNLGKGGFELTDSITSRLSLVDEANRAPPIVQNQFMNLTDGYLELDGRKVVLGDDYHVCVMAVNLGNGDYLGTFDSDAALFDRLVTINLDYFFPKKDLFNILRNNVSTSAHVGVGEDYSDLFKELSSSERITEFFNDFDGSFFTCLAYLVEGLDYCVKGSKREFQGYTTRVCEGCHEKGSYGDFCGNIRSLSVRKAVALKKLYYGLNLVCESEGAAHSKELVLNNLLECFKIVGSYGGVIDKSLLRMHGNPYNIISSINKFVSEKINDNIEDIKNLLYHDYLVGEGKEPSFDKPTFDGALSFLNHYKGKR